MKGRRRARRFALEVLYELDQSSHGVEVVLVGRLESFYRSAGLSAGGGTDAATVDYVVERLLEDGFEGVDGCEVARDLGVEEERVRGVLAGLMKVQRLADFAVELVRGVLAHRAELDQVIARIAPEWPVEQMAPIDRNLLRIALWEMACGASPVRVAINEAVELARQYSGEGARRMVNGALGAYVSGEHRLELPTAAN